YDILLTIAKNKFPMSLQVNIFIILYFSQKNVNLRNTQY
ncbi:unnamed protein product, partial [marine sediment metagenome]